MIRIAVDPVTPQPDALARAAAVLSRGGIVVCPTDTLYGLAVDPWNPRAVEALYRVKRREPGQPILLIAADVRQVERMVGPLPEAGRRLANRFWPGPLSLVIESDPGLARALHSADNRVAVRVPAHSVARLLAETTGYPLTSTSANRSGDPAPASPDDLAASLVALVDLVLDAGGTPGGLPSTIVDVTGLRPIEIRAGAIPWERVLESLANR